MLTVVPGEGSGHEGGKDSSPSLIDEIVREGARRMLAEALQAEVDAYIARFADERDGNGRRLVVRNGCHQSREVLTSAGAVEVTAPRVNDRRTDAATGERMRFASAILPPWARKTPKIRALAGPRVIRAGPDGRAGSRPVGRGCRRWRPGRRR
jgi:predicted amidohydrolase